MTSGPFSWWYFLLLTQRIFWYSLLCSSKRSFRGTASTKSWRQQKAGADAEESSYCLARQRTQLLTSPRPRWSFPTFRWWCCSLSMQSPSVALPLVTLLLWADSLPYCTGLLYRPAMLKTSQILAPTKYWRRPKIHPILSGLHQTFLMILSTC